MKTSNIMMNLNNLFKNISVKKKYIKTLEKQYVFLNNLKQTNYKTINQNLLLIKKNIIINNLLIVYIIDITFSKSNTFLHVMDSSGNLKFYCSAGHLNYKGKTKKFRFQVFKNMYKLLITKLKYLKGKPIALHLKNVGSNKSWIIKKLKTKFIIKLVKVFNIFPFNGCRTKKSVRKKVRLKTSKKIIQKPILKI